MTTEQRQQSLENARRAAWKLAEYAAREMFPNDQMRIDIECLFAEFKRLDAKEQKQIRAGKRYGKLGAEHGKKGGRPRKDAK